MNRGLALVGMLGLIVAFQNCSQETLTSSAENMKATDVAITLPGENAQAAKVSFVEIPDITANDHQAKIGASLGEEESYRLVISVDSGALQILDRANAVMDRGCLSQSDLQELKTILGGSRICQADSVAADQMCSQVYRPGYASLYADEQRISLGEQMDSCGRGKKDLCGELSNVFKAYVAHLKLNWSQMSCE